MSETSGGPIVDPTLWALAHLLDLERVTALAGDSDPVAPAALAHMLCGGLRFGIASSAAAPLRGRRTCGDDLHLLQRVLLELGLEATFGAITPDVAHRLGGADVRVILWVDEASLPWHGYGREHRGVAGRWLALLGSRGAHAVAPEAHRIEICDGQVAHVLDEVDLAAAGAAVPAGRGMALAVVPPPLDALLTAVERAVAQTVRGWALPSAFGTLAEEGRDDGPDAALALARDLLLSDGLGGGASGPLAGLDARALREAMARMWAFGRHVESDGCFGRRVFAEGLRVVSAKRADPELRAQATAFFALATTWREAIEALLPIGQAGTQVRRRTLAYADALRLGADPNTAHLLHDAARDARRALAQEAVDEDAAAASREHAGSLWLAALGQERELVASLADMLAGWRA